MTISELAAQVAAASRIRAAVARVQAPERLRERLAEQLEMSIGLGATSDDRRLAAHYRATLAVAHGSDFEAAPLQAPGRVRAGVVYGYRGAPSWVFVAIYRPYRATAYTFELTMTSGRRVALPSFRLDPRTGSAGQTIPVDLQHVSTIRLIGAGQGGVLQASLRHARSS